MQHIIIDPQGAATSVASAYLVPCTREAIGAAVEAFLERLDAMDGDPDIEDATDLEDEGITWAAQACANRDYPGCPAADPDGPAWNEWTSRGRYKDSPLNRSLPDEDAEQDDAPEDDDPCSCDANEDRGSAYSNDDGLPGDAGDAEQEHDAESEQLGNDVPVLPVYSLRENLFTGKREYLGLNNLQPSFVGNGAQVRSAD